MTSDCTLSAASIRDARGLPDWRRCDTILLDMDGTLLDLAFDNYFWRELVPRCLARRDGTPLARVTAELFALYASRQGSLEWYCLDYWTAELDLDLRGLKSASAHRVRFLPGAVSFLSAVAASGRQVALVTNAHGYTLQTKRGVAGLDRWIGTYLTSHECGVPKESPEFWRAAEARLGFDRTRTLFIDDSPAVLDAAARFGISGVVAIHRPDTGQGPRPARPHPGVDSVGDLLTA